MERNHDHSNQTGFYTREIEERFFLEVPLAGNLKDFFQQDQVPMKLFHEAQKENLLPVFSAGFILHYEKEPAAFSLYLQVLHPAENDERILHLPKSNYLCLQTDVPIQASTKQMLEKRIKNIEKKMVILTKMIEQKLQYENMRCEIQIPLEESAEEDPNHAEMLWQVQVFVSLPPREYRQALLPVYHSPVKDS